MSSSILDSDRRTTSQNARDTRWRRWLLAFCSVFFGVSAFLYILMLLIDPYDAGRFPNFGIVGIDDNNPRTADASRGRDLHFDAAIIGSSTGQNINPYTLSDGTGLQFLQLTVPGSGPREQLALMRWIISRHKSYSAFVIAADPSWCSSDPNLPLNYPFPFWLYRGDLEYLANVLSSKSLDRAAWRLRVALGLRPAQDSVRFFEYRKGENLAYAPEPTEQPSELEGIGSSPNFVWIDRLQEFITSLPRNTGIVILMPPVYASYLPPSGSKPAAALERCKAALARIVKGRPHSGFLDFRVENVATRDVSNWIDNIHYRVALGPPMEQPIIAIIGRHPATVSDAGGLQALAQSR